MKDIDFDELDKAVNSLMGTVSPPKEETSTPPSSPAPTAPPVQVAAAPAAASPDVPSPSTVTTPSRPAVAPAQRRGGRFMDMVHTSSDMKPRPAAAVSREGVTVAPRPEPSTPLIAPAPPLKDGIKDVVPPAEVEYAPAPTWPEPLELSEKKGMAKSEPASAATSVSESATQNAPDVPEPPFESPFLSDAKVEKRPLNPGTPSPTSNVPSDPSEETDTPEPDVATPATDSPRPFVPAELESDLVAIESNEPTTAPPTSGTEDPEEKAQQVAAPQKVTVPASIAQQYREQPSSGDQSHAAIYDTSQFAAPLKHPAKKKAGWLWIIWVILLLALGAGGALALYMAGLI